MDADELITCAVCAYKESPYVEDCIRSLLGQTVKPHIFISTSTPNEFIKGLSTKYNLPLFINTGKGDMKDNWNFAYHQAATPYVTICHQDDFYEPTYVAQLLTHIQQNQKDDIILLHTRWKMLKNGQKQENKCSLVHYVLNRLGQLFPTNRWVRLHLLALGNCVKTPSMCYHKTHCPNPLFTNDYQFALDWQNTRELAARKGRFVYIKEPVFLYRVSDESLTSFFIKNDLRRKEDLQIFQSCWPRPVAWLIAQIYKLTYTVYK